MIEHGEYRIDNKYVKVYVEGKLERVKILSVQRFVPSIADWNTIGDDFAACIGELKVHKSRQNRKFIAVLSRDYDADCFSLYSLSDMDYRTVELI